MGRLFLRIFLWFWLVSTLLVLVSLIGLWIFEPNLLSSLRFLRTSSMLYVATEAADAYEDQGEHAAATLLEDIGRDMRFSAWLYSEDGRLLAGTAPVDGAADLVASAVVNEEVERSGPFRTTVFGRRITSRSGRQYVVLWDARLSQLVSPGALTIRTVMLILSGGVACLWLTWQITKPIRILRATAARFAQGDLAIRISDKREFRRRDELSELARDFDHMATRIEELVKSQQQLLADISHELRSPLARLSLALELARRRTGDGVPEHQRMEREIHRLNELIEQLLMLARMREQSKPEAENVNLRDLVYEVAADASFEAEAAGRRVVVGTACDGTVRGSRALLRSALENVVRNAVRHTPEATEVVIEMERVNGTSQAKPLRISVRDHGPGVPAQALDRLFDPFFRVDEGRDRKMGGVGLGLAITREAMLAHGGSATAQNHPDGGLLIRLDFPVHAL